MEFEHGKIDLADQAEAIVSQVSKPDVPVELQDLFKDLEVTEDGLILVPSDKIST